MSAWDAMWAKPLDFDAHYSRMSLTLGPSDAQQLHTRIVEQMTLSTTTTEYRAGKNPTVWHEQDARAGDEAWREREAGRAA